jgi:hypothetical protein
MDDRTPGTIVHVWSSCTDNLWAEVGPGLFQAVNGLGRQVPETIDSHARGDAPGRVATVEPPVASQSPAVVLVTSGRLSSPTTT